MSWPIMANRVYICTGARPGCAQIHANPGCSDCRSMSTKPKNKSTASEKLEALEQLRDAVESYNAPLLYKFQMDETK